MSSHGSTPPTSHHPISKLPFDQRSVAPIAAMLGTTATLAPFQLPGGAVHQLQMKRDERPLLILTLWPAIRRVDVLSTAATVVFTNVVAVDLVEGVEALFRRASGEYLIITLAGKVIVRA